jgi:TonB family protein
MFKRAFLFCILLSFLSTTTQAWPQQESPPNSLRILVEGETSLSLSIIEEARRFDANYVKFEFVDGPDARHDLRLIVSGGNGKVRPIGCDCSAAQFYYNSIVAFTPDGKLLFTIGRTGDSSREALQDALTAAVLYIHDKTTLLQKQSTFNAGAPQETVKPDAGGVYHLTAYLRPTILYKEKGQYTEEARNNRIEGTVVLSLVFTADGRITSIRVVRGLPHGLTEKAIEAAQKIRFNPAVKDGAPVSVRGTLEFSFVL